MFNEGAILALVLIGGAAIAIVCRLIAGGLNHARIRDYIESKGGTVRTIEWAPFGPGWFGTQNEAMIYRVYFEDANGAEHEAHCKTSMLAGVYLTQDTTIRGPGKPRRESLEEESRRLRAEIERLKREKTV